MKFVLNKDKDIIKKFVDQNRITLFNKSKKAKHKKLIIIFLLILLSFLTFRKVIVDFSINHFNKFKYLFYKKQKTNIDYNNEFFKIREVKEQIEKKKLKYINTIFGGKAKIGNALILLDKLIEICRRIKCTNIICPRGLEKIIKNPIYDKSNNINIFPNKYTSKMKIDININKRTLFWFNFRNKSNENRLLIIRDEILRNVPRLDSKKSDLYIHIRSGDIFIKTKNRIYSQPPLCFYQKIINENNFSIIYIISNGNENPVINILLKTYPKIIFDRDSVEKAISIILYSYNFVMSVSSFIMSLIPMNKNLQNLYVYQIYNYKLKHFNCTIHKMIPSYKYTKLMKHKWQISQEQLHLLVHEKCTNSSFIILNQTNINKLK